MSKEKKIIPPIELITQNLLTKSVMKQQVYKNSVNALDLIKGQLRQMETELREATKDATESIKIDFNDKGTFGADFSFAGDTLIFIMHTNVFEFDQSHQLWKTSYLNDDPQRAYCGIIHIYNFLTDSFKYHRHNDLGYLIARIFVNKENHFWIEGKRQMGFLYNDFAGQIINNESIRKVLESLVLYCIEFDALTPPYENVIQASVGQIREVSEQMLLSTGKRVGFKFFKDSIDPS
jgi:hypothetical protein